MSSANVAKALCEVCGDAAWKYKAPCCKVRYCGPDCYANHFEVNDCDGIRKEAPAERNDRLTTIAEHRLREKETIDGETVGSKQLEAITQDATVQQSLRDPALQALIRNIDGSIDRQVSLTDAVEATPEFRDFVDHLATLINIHQPPASAFTDAVGQKRKRDAAAKGIQPDDSSSSSSEEDPNEKQDISL
ncbi:hypothetical protein DIPPA_32505 [Diplonema papillatum]|nr:hypothetical protein DIPPA_32505 [Diplonema papillatum]